MSVGLLSFRLLPAYEGLVASRARVPYTKDTTNKYMMVRSAHVATEILTSIKIAFGNFYVGAGSDQGLGASTSITAAIEYNGSFWQVQFSASPNGTIPDIGILFSDYLSVSIPAGATFWVRAFWHNAVGTFYNLWQNTFLGESCNLSATTLTDQTMSGNISNTASVSYPPVAVLGMTKNPSAVILGDSIAAGYPFGLDVQDSSSSATGYDGKVGVVARSLGPIPFINLSVGGEAGSVALANSTARKLLWPKASHVICEYAGVDLRAGNTSSQVVSISQSLYANFASWQKIYQTTMTPLDVTDPGTPSAQFTTLSQQTPGSEDTQRQAFNVATRAGSVGRNGFFDVASVVESGLTSGKWIVSPSPPYTGDGIHPSMTGNQLIAASGVIDPTTLTYS